MHWVVQYDNMKHEKYATGSSHNNPRWFGKIFPLFQPHSTVPSWEYISKYKVTDKDFLNILLGLKHYSHSPFYSAANLLVCLVLAPCWEQHYTSLFLAGWLRKNQWFCVVPKPTAPQMSNCLGLNYNMSLWGVFRLSFSCAEIIWLMECAPWIPSCVTPLLTQLQLAE